MIGLNEPYLPTKSPPDFLPGELVHHRRYGYRGVVVAVDTVCKASAKWYQGNQTQPEREQPWYHLFVHGSEQVNYAAQTSLERDTSDEPIDHPLVKVFFHGFEQGRYQRNDVAWPGWE